MTTPVPADPHHFDFDLDRGIRDQVITALEASPLLALERGAGPTSSGIYALYYRRDLVYIGKATREMTSSGRTLRDRINEHVSKIEGRVIDMTDMQFRYLLFDSEWWVIAAEYALMRHYAPDWNNSGFGSKTPGRGRPGTERVSRWDGQFPSKPT